MSIICSVLRTALAVLLLACSASAFAQSVADRPRVHIVYMGGNDCPPCRTWRSVELPELKKTEAFNNIKFSWVIKSIASPVPPSFLLPTDVKPYKDKLDAAGGGNGGSPQFVVLVNDEVHDFFFGTKSAVEIEKIITAIHEGRPYPFSRCVKRGPGWKCETPA